MSIRSKFKKARQQGLIRTTELLFNEYVPPWVFRYSMGDIYDFDLDSLCRLGDNPSDHPLEVRTVEDKDERQQLREFTWNTVPVETTLNDLGYGVYHAEDGRLLGGVWGGVGSFLENNLGIQFQFRDDQAWLYNAFVDGSARGMGVYKTLVSYAAQDLRDRGFERVFGIVQPWNLISRKMHEQHSLGICGRMSAARVLHYVWVSHEGEIQVDRRLVTNVADPALVSIL